MTASTRCPRCAARLRPDDAWCGQCHHDLRPAPPHAAPPGARSAPGTTASTAAPAAAAAAAPAAPADVEALAAAWAQRLAETERGAGLPGLPGAGSGRGGRAALSVGVGVGLVVLLLVAMAVAGALL